MEAVKNTIRMVSAGFAIGPVMLVIVVALMDLGEPESPELADGATLAVAVIGLIGLLIASLWYSRAGDRPRRPDRVQNGFIVRVAIAELGLLLGVVGLFMTGSLLPMFVGLGLFLPSLLLLYLGVNRIEPI